MRSASVPGRRACGSIITLHSHVIHYRRHAGPSDPVNTGSLRPSLL